MNQNQTIPKVCVIIPNKNGLSHLVYSLPSLMNTSYSNYHCILVDNDSSDDSISFVEHNFKSIQILENKEGKGFASTVNIGIKHALEQDASFIAVYNSDIKVLPEWIDLTLTIFDKERKIGLVGFTEITKEREELFYNTNISRDNLEYLEVRELVGCLYLCHAEVFNKLGLYDEDYFMYGEDNDFFIRLKSAGYKLMETNVPVWHFGEGSSKNKRLMATWLAYRNALRFALKNESSTRIVRMFLALLNQGCNPFLPKKPDNNVYKRMRRYNILTNLMLIVGSCCWNLSHLVPTLKARFDVKNRLRKIRAHDLI